MTVQNLPHIDEFRKILRYDFATGNLVWMRRPKSFFKRQSDFVFWNRMNAGKVAGCKMNDGYIRLKAFGKMIAAHRLVWALHFGQWPKAEIDHINGNRSDNRITNLRLVNKSENQRNKKIQKNNKSGTPGVFWNKKAKKWEVSICGKYIGVFKEKQDAIDVRKKEELKMNFHKNNGRN